MGDEASFNFNIFFTKRRLNCFSGIFDNYYSLRRKIDDDDVKSVGGPIDVAIITKDEGFVWTKCHDSFDKDLNPQYFNKKY